MQSPAVVEHERPVEIHPREIQRLECCGRGSFGVVDKGIWRNNIVAIKTIYGENSKQSFETELTQLSRLSHRNIVKLFGACTRIRESVFLVMEYADGGSLYDVLHKTKINYTLAHAVSWATQCASGIAYLHSLKPKPMVHRDLKTPNLLLFDKGNVVKICDLGFACDIHSIMSVTRGTFAWMAPEVFHSTRYTEKCDVYSWAVVLWHVLSRKKPYEEMNSYQIMWAVYNGHRPPLLKNCPKCIETLMTSCWSGNVKERPPIAEVEARMSEILKVCARNGLPPLDFANAEAVNNEDDYKSSYKYETENSGTQVSASETTDGSQFINHSGFQSSKAPYSVYHQGEGAEEPQNSSHYRVSPAGHHLRLDVTNHRLGKDVDGIGASRLLSRDGRIFIGKNYTQQGFDHSFLDSELLPIDPDPNSAESMQIYKEHKQACREYLQKRVKADLLQESKRHLETLLQNGCSTPDQYAEIEKLQNDRDALLKFKMNLQTQLDLIHNGGQDFSDLEDFVIVKKAETPKGFF